MVRILVMDDDTLYAATLAECLASLGYEIKTVETGQEAIELLKNNNLFDVAFFDIENEKGLGGVETIEKMRRNNPILPFPIIAMSGNNAHDAIVSPGDFGFAMSFKKKSMRLQNLKDVIGEVLREKVGA